MNIYDPLSIIIKLGIFSKKKIGTKLSIKNYIIEIQEISYYQSLYRYLNNDNRYDIQLLGIPIDTACKKYLNNNYILLHPNIVNLFKFAQDGLINLIKLYNNKIINQYIQEIIDNINKHILNLPINSPIYRKKTMIYKQKYLEKNKFNDNIKNLKNNRSLESLKTVENVKSNTNKTIIRYSTTGFFILNDDNENDIINNNNVNNIIHNDKDNEDDYNDIIWNNNNIKFIIILMDNYINNIDLITNIIELFMKNIDNIFINSILYKRILY